MTDENRTLAKLIAQKFIARPDVMARQSRFGTYSPVHSAFTMDSLLAHLTGTDSLGHYLINPAGDEVKLFAIDIDLEQPSARKPDKYHLPFQADEFGQFSDWRECNPRQLWMSREQGPARDCMKFQMKMIASKLVAAIQRELEIPALAAYSGSKGVHVYGFTGKTSAEFAREGALIVLEATGWRLSRGQNFFTYNADLKDTAFGNYYLENYHQYSVEVFPKQVSIAEKEKNLGNLMRLPLGVNYKSPKDRAFFLDLRTAMQEFKPMNPIEALTTTNPWAFPHEF